MRFYELPEVREARSLIHQDELRKLTSNQSPSRFVRITSLWIMKLGVVFIAAPSLSFYWWPFLFLLSVAIVEGFRNWSHESLHQRIFSGHNAINSVLTHLLIALPIMTPFGTRRTMHLSHHRGLDSESDLERFAWRDFNPSRLPREIWLSLSGSRFVGGALAARNNQQTNESRQLVELVTLLSYMFVAMGVCIFFGVLIPYLLLWIMPQVLVSPFINRVRSFAEHGSIRGLPVSRTTIAGPLETFFMYQVRFGYHFEHHVWPGIPEDSLKKVHALLEQRGFFNRWPTLIQESGVATTFARLHTSVDGSH